RAAKVAHRVEILAFQVSGDGEVQRIAVRLVPGDLLPHEGERFLEVAYAAQRRGELDCRLGVRLGPLRCLTVMIGTSQGAGGESILTRAALESAESDGETEPRQ